MTYMFDVNQGRYATKAVQNKIPLELQQFYGLLLIVEKLLEIDWTACKYLSCDQIMNINSYVIHKIIHLCN